MAPFSSIAFPACPLKLGGTGRIVAAAHMVIHKHDGSQYGGRFLNGCVAIGEWELVEKVKISGLRKCRASSLRALMSGS